MNIGVLALQGDVEEHMAAVERVGARAIRVRTPSDLAHVNGLVLPGGESTVIGKFLQETKLDTEIIKRVNEGMPIWGTCAGAILLATEIENSSQPRLNLQKMQIRRNAYGRQTESFETVVQSTLGPLSVAFIRAPIILSAEGEVLAEHEGSPVLLQNKNILVSTFHTELTGDDTLLKHFLSMCESF